MYNNYKYKYKGFIRKKKYVYIIINIIELSACPGW